MLPSGYTPHRIAPKGGPKLKDTLSNLKNMFIERTTPHQCICTSLPLAPKHQHPKLVNNKEHLCTTDMNVLSPYPKLRQVLSISPNFRPNRHPSQHTINTKLREAAAMYLEGVVQNSPADIPAALQAAIQAANHTVTAMQHKQYQNDLPEGWEAQYQAFVAAGGVISHADKETKFVITCQTLAIQMSLELVRDSDRYTPTAMTELQVQLQMQTALDTAIGGHIPVADKMPDLRCHIKSHKTKEEGGMTYRPTTNARDRGACTHAKILYQLLKTVVCNVKTSPDYRCINSSTHFQRLLPPQLDIANSADIRGFFTEITHPAIIKATSRLFKELFLANHGQHLRVTRTSAIWNQGPADANDPYSYDAPKATMLLTTMLANDYTIAGSTIYKADEGVPMGASYSSEVASLTIYYLERTAIPLIQQHHHQLGMEPFFFTRYCDDAFHNTSNDIFLAVMDPILRVAGCKYIPYKEQDPRATGIPFLEARVHISQQHSVSTTHYSKSFEINKRTPLLPQQGGAVPQSVYRQAVYAYCRAAYTNSSHINTYINQVRKLARPRLHPRYNKRMIAAVAADTLAMPKKSRYGDVTNPDALEKHIRQAITSPHAYT